MICHNLPNLIGFACHPLDDAGQVAMIETPFKFNDGDPVPVFVEQVGSRVRFFDDGWLYLQFKNRGLSMANAAQTRFIKTAVESRGGSFTKQGEVELWSSADAAPDGFARYLEAVTALTHWEREHTGVDVAASLFIEEVAQYLRSWRPQAEITTGAKLTGVTGKSHEFDFSVDGTQVLAVGMHHAAVSAALRKLMDVHNSPDNSGLQTLVVLDDRHDPQAAKSEALIIGGISSCITMTRLQKNAGGSARAVH